MSNIVRLTATNGDPVEFVDSVIGQGAMKDVYFSPNKDYVVAFFRDPQDRNARERLEDIVGRYREGIYGREGGEYWKSLFCWPTHILEYEGKLGLVAPTYQKHFFFQYGSVNNDILGIRGNEKEGK